MKKLLHFFAVALCFAGGTTTAAALQLQNLNAQTDDNQFWTEGQAAVPLNSKVDLILGGTLRFGREFSIRTEERGFVGAAFKPNRFFTVTTIYAEIGGQTLGGTRLRERRAIVNASFRVPVKKFVVTNRNLIEYRFRRNFDNAVRIRPRIGIEYPVSIGETSVNVFVKNEAFYDSGADAWTRNRFSVGANKRLSKAIVGEIYYLRQTDNRVRPGNLNVFGVTIRAALDSFSIDLILKQKRRVKFSRLF